MNALYRDRAKARGFTLIELVVTVAILGTALAMMAPSLTGWIRGVTVRSSAESIRAGIEKARLEALRRNTPMGFWLVSDSNKTLGSACALSTSGPSWVVSGASPAGKCDSAPSSTTDPLLVEKWSSSELGSSVTIRAVDAAGNTSSSLVFNSLGQLQTAGNPIVRVDISSSAAGVRNLRVLVQSGGSVRLCDPNVGSGDPRKC